MLQRTIGNHATLRILAQRRGRLAGNEPRDEHEHGPDLASLTRGETPNVSWDFPKTAIRASVLPSGCQTAFPPSAPGARGLAQPKLAVGEVNDPLEHEADRVADRVMRMSIPEVPIAAGLSQISRKCAACEDETETLRTKSAVPFKAATDEAPNIVYEVLRSPGRPLDAEARSFFEPRFGHDFSRVRVHTDSLAAESARSVGALAYTVGKDIVFGRNQYKHDAGAGDQLLAHELAHTIQQQGGTAAQPQRRRLGRVSVADPLLIRRQRRRPVAPAHPATPTLGTCRPIQDDLRPTAPWADLQRTYRSRCASAVSDVAGQAERTLEDLLNGRAPPAPHLPDARSSIDCACAYMSPKDAARAAMVVVRAAGPLAASLFWHFLDASGTPMTIDVAAMISRSAGVRAKIRRSIARGGMSGTTRLEQHEYGDRELQFAYGAIDCVQWQAMPPARRAWRSDPSTHLRISMLDYYEFHPARPGVSQCAHAACVEAVARGEAKNFWTRGEATVTWRDLQL